MVARGMPVGTWSSPRAVQLTSSPGGMCSLSEEQVQGEGHTKSMETATDIPTRASSTGSRASSGKDAMGVE